MPFNTLVSAGIETLSNQLLKSDKHSRQRLSAIAGRVVSVQISPFPTLFFVISEQQLDVLNNYEGNTDGQVKIAVSNLPELKHIDNIPMLIKQDKLQVEGDLKLVQQFADLFLKLNLDIEEKLSSVLGDAFAYQVVSTLKALSEALKQGLEKTPKQLHRLAIEEWDLELGQAEFQDWKQQVEALEQQLEQLSQRVENIS